MARRLTLSLTAKPKRLLKRPAPAQKQGLAKLAEHKSDFIMAAAHQLKSPLAIVQWSLQSVLELGAVDDRSRKHVTQALAQANSMNQLISDMLHLVRLVSQHENITQTFEPIDVQKVIGEVIDLFKPLAERGRVRLIREAKEILPKLYGEEAYFKQALCNLVDNAIKYTPEGKSVTVHAHHTKGAIVFYVQDEGIGIPEAEQSRLFSEFFRGEEAKRVSREGTGLGLVLVKHITEAFGGTVHVESKIGKGTRITLTFEVPGKE